MLAINVDGRSDYVHRSGMMSDIYSGTTGESAGCEKHLDQKNRGSEEN